MIVAQVLIRALKSIYPDCVVDVVAPRITLPLATRMPEVANAIPLDATHGEVKLMLRYKLGCALRKRGYTQAYVLPRAAKAALVPFFAQVPRRTGYRGEHRYGLLNDIRKLNPKHDQLAEKWAALALEEDRDYPAVIHPELRVDTKNQVSLIRRESLAGQGPVAAIAPGAAYGPAKRWPVEYFHQLAQRLDKAGWRIWVFGSPAEKCLGDAIVTGTRGRNLCGHTELIDAVDLLAAADIVVSNDSGLMHVACAAGAKVIAIYGSSSPKYTPPLSSLAESLYLEIDCSPCFRRECPLGHLHCLRGIGVDDVYRRVASLASSGRAR